jgi:prevent-host-death family protein
MRFLSVRELRQRGKEVWQALRSGEDLVITSNGRPVGVLIGVREHGLEETLRWIRSARALESVARIRNGARRSDLDRLGEDEIQAEIRAVRAARRR